MLKEIFNNIEGKEWDWFGFGMVDYAIRDSSEYYVHWLTEDGSEISRSIADLLSNPSLCKVWWGEKLDAKHFQKKGLELTQEELDNTSLPLLKAFKYHSDEAHRILRDQGQAPALKYILDTMIKKAV